MIDSCLARRSKIAILLTLVSDLIFVSPLLGVPLELVLFPLMFTLILIVFATGFGAFISFRKGTVARIAVAVTVAHTATFWSITPSTNYFGETFYVGAPAVAWALSTLVVTAVGLFGWENRDRERRMNAMSRCIVCEYDLTGNVSGVCSECGSQIGNVPRTLPGALSVYTFRAMTCGVLLALVADFMIVTAAFRGFRELGVTCLVTGAAGAFFILAAFDSSQGRYLAGAIALCHAVFMAMGTLVAPSGFFGSETILGNTVLWKFILVIILVAAVSRWRTRNDRRRLPEPTSTV